MVGQYSSVKYHMRILSIGVFEADAFQNMCLDFGVPPQHFPWPHLATPMKHFWGRDWRQRGRDR